MAFQSPELACSCAHALTSSISARRWALCSAASVRILSSHASTTLCAALQASSNFFHRLWLGAPPWSACFHCSRRLRRVSCILRPPRAWPSGRLSKASALATRSSRTWSALQRCQPSSSPAATRAVCTCCSRALSMCLPCTLSTARSAAAAPALAFP
ncbi:hypothetical protein D3C72_1868370 [compost metagenome]